ncbi:BgTH12-05091 [Blumeria graminis f. sp. triticale]|uniref:BgTH12-05091 n=1 Tax=Blumeria graminis f. sp. triticale TaxID=1689686 RepID=A0A9W4DIQ5_BLUGR|nr:BgTH12-05091 [Blumeria graminis f. sp. triticale]
MGNNDSPRPSSISLVDTPDGPYIYGTGAPFDFFTFDPVNAPAVVTTNLGAWPKRYWPEYLEDLPAPIEYQNMELMAIKLAIYFVTQNDPTIVSGIPRPMSPYDLYIGFDAVHIYQYGLDFCYKVLCHISRLGKKIKRLVLQEKDTNTPNWAIKRNSYFAQQSRVDDNVDEFVRTNGAHEALRRILAADCNLLSQLVKYYREFHLDGTTVSSETQLFEDVVQSYTNSEDNGRLDLEQNEDDEISLQSYDNETSSFGYSMDETYSLDLIMPYTRNFRSKIPVLVCRRKVIPGLNNTCGNAQSSNADVGKYNMKALPSKIPGPIKLSSKSRMQKPSWMPSRMPFNSRDNRFVYIARLRSVDLMSGKSKIPMLSSRYLST